MTISDYARLEKFDIRGLIFTLTFSIAALIASATLVIPFLVTLPLWVIKWPLSFVTNHSGAISDAIIVSYWLFIYLWATKLPLWTVRIVYFFGIFNLFIALGYTYKGVSRGIDNNLFFFPSAPTTTNWVLIAILCAVYLVVMYKIAKLGHKKYLAKWRQLEEAEKEEAAQYTTCPFCAETILAKANVCKHCGRDLI